MGVDYTGVGGVGIELTDDHLKAVFASGKFTEEEWEEDHYACLEELGIEYAHAGNAYSGEECIYLFVKGETLEEVYNNAPTFCEKLKEIGIELEPGKLGIIADMHIW